MTVAVVIGEGGKTGCCASCPGSPRIWVKRFRAVQVRDGPDRESAEYFAPESFFTMASQMPGLVRYLYGRKLLPIVTVCPHRTFGVMEHGGMGLWDDDWQQG